MLFYANDLRAFSSYNYSHWGLNAKAVDFFFCAKTKFFFPNPLNYSCCFCWLMLMYLVNVVNWIRFKIDELCGSPFSHRCSLSLKLQTFFLPIKQDTMRFFDGLDQNWVWMQLRTLVWCWNLLLLYYKEEDDHTLTEVQSETFRG